MEKAARRRWLNIALLLTSGLGYLEWADQRAILFGVEGQLLTQLFDRGVAIVHPAVAFPFLGQLLLIFACIANPPKMWRTYVASAAIGALHLMIFYIGIISGNFLMISSVIPFLALSVFAVVGRKSFLG
jgi:hypothetical protein